MVVSFSLRSLSMHRLYLCFLFLSLSSLGFVQASSLLNQYTHCSVSLNERWGITWPIDFKFLELNQIGELFEMFKWPKRLIYLSYEKNDVLEAPEERSKKVKLFFANAVEQWDAEFYIKANDDIYVNIGKSTFLISCLWAFRGIVSSILVRNGLNVHYLL